MNLEVSQQRPARSFSGLFHSDQKQKEWQWGQRGREGKELLRGWEEGQIIWDTVYP